MENIDCLLIHVPKFHNYYKLLGPYVSHTYMTFGLLSVADNLDRNGFKCQVLHLYLELLNDSKFSLVDYIKKHNVKVAGLSLAFHHQSFDVIEKAKEIKAACPDTYVMLGGMTASFFGAEIMKDFDAVDGIIRGEGEKPLLDFMNERKKDAPDYSVVPNLVWRRNGEIVENDRSYVATNEDLDNLCFTNFSLLKNYKLYQNLRKGYVDTNLPRKFTYAVQNMLSAPDQILYGLCLGKGCLGHCAHCCAGKQGQLATNNRKKPGFRSHDKVIEEILMAKEYGYKGFYISFEPFPTDMTEFYTDFFAKIRKRKIEFLLRYSAWGLPKKQFIDAFKETCTPDSSLMLSPESASENIRKKNKSWFYTNDALLETLAYLEKLKIHTSLYFSYGLTHETEKEVMETVAFQDVIKKKFKTIHIETFPIEIEPGAPRHADPDKYGIVVTRSSFMDFYNTHSSKSSSMSTLGFYRTDFFNDKVNDEKEFSDRMLKLKCKHFCAKTRAAQPFICAIMDPCWKIAGALKISG